jgi:hypothetical protein
MFLLFEHYVVRAIDSVSILCGFKLPLDDKARVPLPTPQNDYLLRSSRQLSQKRRLVSF